MKKFTTAAALMFAVALSASSADAALLVGTFDGDDCTGVFGDSFVECAIPVAIDPDRSPVIAKFAFAESGAIIPTLNLALFPSLSGGEWSFDLELGTWTYAPGPGDPAITFFVVKGGPKFNLFSLADDELSGPLEAPLDPSSNRPYGLSHVTFYDTAADSPAAVAPEPATMGLLGLGLIAASLARRRAK